MRKNSRFTLEERRQIAKDYADGMSLRAVASKWGTASSSIQRIINREGGMRDHSGIYPRQPDKGLLGWLKQ